jgi:hypothetical protein
MLASPIALRQGERPKANGRPGPLFRAKSGVFVGTFSASADNDERGSSLHRTAISGCAREGAGRPNKQPTHPEAKLGLFNTLSNSV